MPEIIFRGKEYVYNHHLTVPYRPLVVQADKGVGAPDLAGNLVIQGDNLAALKSLLPRYAGKVDLVFIDPPYNTGNEGWSYNDNVNSPIMREWLAGNPVDGEDMLRHDKWLCMMWPRLVLLRELLSEGGSIWMTLDDNEVHRARMVMDEVFGESNFVASVIWQKNFSPKNTAQFFSEDHDYVLVAAKNKANWRPNLHQRTMEMEAHQPRIKRYLSEVKQGRTPQTLWFHEEVGHTQEAKKTLLELGVLGGEHATMTPKPVGLIERVIELAADSEAVVLDSFAGSGTTAHAVLRANARDDGARRFILVECEEYADSLTAERVRRVIRGYAWQGTQRETLLEQKVTYTQLKKADALLAQVDAVAAREGFAEGDLADQGAAPRPKRFDSIETKVEDGLLRVEGVRRVSERAPGLGGSFTYCTLGEPLSVNKMLSGERLPAFAELGEWLFHTATGGTLPPRPGEAPPWYLGAADDAHLWLVYRPDLAFLKSADAALTLTLARQLADWGRSTDEAAGKRRKHLVFAPAKYLSNQQLAQFGVDFAPLPYALYREG